MKMKSTESAATQITCSANKIMSGESLDGGGLVGPGPGLLDREARQCRLRVHPSRWSNHPTSISDHQDC